MAGVVKSMDATLESMNLEKVNRLTFLGAACQKQKGQQTQVLKRGISTQGKRFCSEVYPRISCEVFLNGDAQNLAKQGPDQPP